MDTELTELLTKVAGKKLSIVQFVTRLKKIQERLGSAFDAEFQESINSILDKQGKVQVDSKDIEALRNLFSKEARKAVNG